MLCSGSQRAPEARLRRAQIQSPARRGEVMRVSLRDNLDNAHHPLLGAASLSYPNEKPRLDRENRGFSRNCSQRNRAMDTDGSRAASRQRPIRANITALIAQDRHARLVASALQARLTSNSEPSLLVRLTRDARVNRKRRKAIKASARSKSEPFVSSAPRSCS
jgi:hypothetical protein